ncbi:MAG: MmgE/PrpD family protein [Peptococcaceae bacterium]
MLITQKFAQFIEQTNYDSLSPQTIALAKERILDTLGSALAGYASWDYRRQLIAACRHLGSGDSSIIGSGKKEFPAARAAMLNAAFAHAIELDDGHKNAGVHAGAVIIPTALAMAEKLGVGGKEMITAVVIGYEVVYRIASHVNPQQIRKGFHPSGNCGTFGAMAVAGKLLGLKREQLANGLGFAGLFTAGLMEATQSGQQSKCIQVGNAAYNGISAAYMAQGGLEGTVTVFEGKSGFFNAQSENVDLEAVCRDLGTVYSIGDTYSKLYPTCRHSQPAIEAVLDIIAEERFGWEDVEQVLVGTHQVAYDLTGTIREPKDAGEAKFSLPYGVALALNEHSVGICHLAAEYRNKQINKKLAALVKVTVDPEVQAEFPAKRGAKVQILLKDGRCFARECYDLKGSPNNPIGWAELARKFVGNTTGVISQAHIEQLMQRIADLEQEESVAEIIKLLK